MSNEFNLPSLVKRYLTQTGTTQRELSRMAGISEITLSRIMNGASEPSGGVIKKLWPYLCGDGGVIAVQREVSAGEASTV